MVALTRNIESENLLLSEQRDAAMTRLQTTCAALEDVAASNEKLVHKIDLMAHAATLNGAYYLVPRKQFEDVLYHFSQDQE